ncbi:MAG TPA: prepilin-type N-terminal cleavage/methylation domain-containing protein [Phycisphaerales bacterium]|nr:prepilin-type N-terminal cleavage/methylation domain-containing protein [Phycisphaerales bacterium]
MNHRTRTHARRAFSLVEMLIALTISATLLTATLTAFDASWRAYKDTTESASTHVVSRIVMHRILAMVRTGTEFGPYPDDVLDASQNPLTSTSIEFVAEADRLAGNNRVTRIERRAVANTTDQFELWYVLINRADGSTIEERPLLANVREALFILEYEPGPRLVRATIDLSIRPNDEDDLRVGGIDRTPMIRLVASAEPRQLQ